MKSCPPAERLEQLLEEKLSAPLRDEVSAHVAGCSSCQEALERLTEPPDSLLSVSGRSTSGQSASALSARLLDKLERAAPARPPVIPPGQLPAVPGYQVLEEVGRGGMGVVYRAVHERLNRTVALKMILAGPHAGRRDIDRFRLEAEAVAQLHHPNIVQIYDIGEANGHPYCALELVEGGSLVGRLRSGPPSPETAARLVEVLARTVHFAHEHGIVHRDLKPANILLQEVQSETTSPPDSALCTLHSALVPKITDFGLAKRLDVQEQLSLSAEVIGTPSYMAPEQAAGRPRRVGPLADVYSLGAILYEMLTGHPPFKGATALDTVLQVLHEEPVRPGRLRPEVPRDLENICLKCLEKTPSRRYGSALELAEDLRRFRKGDPVLARPVGPRERFSKWVRRRPAFAALLGCLVTIVLLSLALGAWQLRVLSRARDDAVQANNRARAALYRDAITKSQMRWRLNDFTEARLSLHNWEDSFSRNPGQDDPRGWEWDYLQGLYQSDLLTRHHAEGGASGGLVVAPNGRWVASVITGQKEARVWSTEDGSLLFTLAASPWAQRLAVRPDSGAIAIADTGGGVAIWDVSDSPRKKPWRKKNLVNLHTGSISGLAFSPDGKWLATASWDKSVKVWNAETGQLRYGALQHSARVHSVTFSPNGEYLATGSQSSPGLVREEGLVILWDARSGKPLQTLEGHKSAVYGVAFSPSGMRLASAGSNGNVRVWDLEPWLKQVARKKRFALIQAWAGSHSHVADCTLAAWLATSTLTARRNGAEIPGPRVMLSLTGNGGAALGISYSPDGRYIAYGCSDSTARIWYLSTGVLRAVFRGHTSPVEVVRFSPDSQRLYSCSPEQGAVKAWDLTRSPEYSTLAQTRHPEFPVQGPGGEWPAVKVRDLLQPGDLPYPSATTGPDVEALRFSADGQTLYSVTVLGRLQTWDASSGMLLDERALPLTVQLYSPAVLADFSPDGELLAARRDLKGDGGKVVGVWEVASRPGERRSAEPGKALIELKGHRYPVYGVRFSADGRHLATFAYDRAAAGRPHEVKVWQVNRSTDKPNATLLGGWEGHGQLFCLAFSPDGRYLALGGDDGHLEVVDWARSRSMPLRWDHRKAVTAVAFSRSGRWLASAGMGDPQAQEDAKRLPAVRVYDTSTWKESARAESPGLLTDLAFSEDEKRLAGISRDVVKLWDVRTGQELLTLRGAPRRHRDPPFNARLTFSPDGRRLVGSNWDESISIWEAEPPSPERQEVRRAAAARRATLWHLQEAENCLLAIPPYLYATRFHLDHIDRLAKQTPLSAPLKTRKDHLELDLKQREDKEREKKPGQ